MSAIALDDFAYSRAKALVARELPSRDQEARFRLTKTLTFVGFALGLLWLGVLVIYDPAQRFVLFPAAVSLLAAEALFLSNITYLWRLWRSWRTARRLGFSSRLRARRGRVPATDRLLHAALVALAMFGVVLLVVSGIGLYDAFNERRWMRAGVAFGALVLAIKCVLLRPMAWVRDHLHDVWALQAELDSAATVGGDTPVAIQPAVWDDLAEIERKQIETDRAIAASSRRVDTTKIGLHISAEFFQALARLDAGAADQVRLALDTISLDKQQRPRGAGSGPIEHMPVPSTRLSIAFRRRSGRRVDVLGVRLADDSGGADA